MKKHKIWRK